MRKQFAQVTENDDSLFAAFAMHTSDVILPRSFLLEDGLITQREPPINT